MIRLSVPPGGASTINLGSGVASSSPGMVQTPTSATAHAAPVSAPAPAAEEQLAAAVATADVHAAPALEVLKLQVISATVTAKDSDVVRTALVELLKKLQMPGGALAQPESTGASAQESVVPSSGDVAMDAFRAALKLRGTHGIISIGKRFRSMDDDNDRKLCYDEFKKACQEMKLGLTEADMTRLFRRFDADANGSVSFNELLVGLRGQLNERRTGMVRRAFKVLDKTGDGLVTLADLEGRYDASRHPDVVAGSKATREVLLEFLETFEQGGGGTVGDGVVTLEEFMAYYSMVSASVDDDDYFELMIRNVWHISGGEGWCANTTCKRLLVTHGNGTQTVQEVKDDFDVNLKDTEAVKKLLIEQGIQDIQSVSMYGDMQEAAPEPAQATTPTPRAAAGTAANSSSAGPAAGRGRSMQSRSSIVFG